MFSLQKNKANLITKGFVNTNQEDNLIKGDAQEGVYADNYKNRKLGIVGKSYAQVAKEQAAKNGGGVNKEEKPQQQSQNKDSKPTINKDKSFVNDIVKELKERIKSEGQSTEEENLYQIAEGVLEGEEGIEEKIQEQFGVEDATDWLVNELKSSSNDKKEVEDKKENKGEFRIGEENKSATSHSSDKEKSDWVSKLVNSNSTPQEKLQSLAKLGIIDPKLLVGLSGANLSDVISSTPSNVKPNEKNTKEVEKITEDTEIEMPQAKLWATYKGFVDLVIKGKRLLCFAYGSGGVGKTYTVEQSLKNWVINEAGETRQLKEGEEPTEEERRFRRYDPEIKPSQDEYDYVFLKGSSSPAALYKAMYEHNGKLVIIDDCDDIFSDKEAVNLLKNGTDDKGNREVGWLRDSRLKTSDGQREIPGSFNFKGRIIAITNLPRSIVNGDTLQPIVNSRAMPLDLTMNKAQTIEKLDTINYKMPYYDAAGNDVEVSNETRDAALGLLKKYKDKINIKQFNSRTLGSLAIIKDEFDSVGGDWESAAISMLGLAKQVEEDATFKKK